MSLIESKYKTWVVKISLCETWFPCISYEKEKTLYIFLSDSCLNGLKMYPGLFSDLLPFRVVSDVTLLKSAFSLTGKGHCCRFPQLQQALL